MFPCVRCTDNVRFAERPDPGGIRILEAVSVTARKCGHDIWITSAADGVHSGPDDPHPEGKAFDLRTKDVPDKYTMLAILQGELYGSPRYFYAFLEDAGTKNEHIHVQVRKGQTWPPPVTFTQIPVGEEN